MGKNAKTWSAINKNEFWSGKFFLKNFYVTSASPGPDLALKHPGVLRLEVLEGLHYFVFCLNFRQVNQINQKLWAKKVFLNKMGILGAFLAIKVPRGREQDSKNGWTVKFQVLGPVNLNSAP